LEPQYIQLLKAGSFPAKIENAKQLLQKCCVCPQNCLINRTKGELGECFTGNDVIISSAFPHFGEESPLVGIKGSGTIFMAGCNLKCLFCQNYELSHNLEGHPVSINKFSEMMLDLQHRGCHNINIVTPSHIVPQLIEAIYGAARKGLKIPLVYNSSGYDSLNSLQLLDGIVDIYMPDFKFYDDNIANKYTDVENYASVAIKAIKEMYSQVGDLIIVNGIARRGILIRHLVMPNQLEQSRKIFDFIAKEISKNTYLNIMPQYRPYGKAKNYADISRDLRHSEFLTAIQAAKKVGLHRLDKE
jgi:putative pyruvate formate lyase activating enzyme